MPPKVLELISQLKASGFEDRDDKGSHRNFTHPNVVKPITVSGKSGDDAKIYQIAAVKKAIEESQQ